MLTLVFMIAAYGVPLSTADGGPPSLEQLDPTPLMAATTRPKNPPCVGQPMQAPGPYHVVWIFMENKSYSDVLEPNAAHPQPFLDYLARACGVATNYHNITHHSLA